MLDMLAQFAYLFNADDFMPHGHCFLWEPGILWLHVVSDAIIALAYFSIPVAISVFAVRRSDLPFRHIFALFGAFIVLCGSTHLFSIWVLWHPDYMPEGLLKALTALVSLATAVQVWRILPKALTLPSPSDLQIINSNLQQSNARIESEVERRTVELQAANDRLTENEQALQIALHAAEAASKAKTDFLANMSHEIRTPMNALVGLTHILSRDKTLTSRQAECIRTMDISASALMDLLNDLLDIAKIEAGQIELYKRPFSLRTILNEAIIIMSVRAREKNLSLTLDVDSAPLNNVDGCDYIGDAARLRQILTNLLGNAVKFTEKGGITLRAEENPLPNGSAIVTFEIVDTGIGIAAEHLPQIFEKFAQADTSISRRYGGSGLGLAITRSLVEQMNGQISVASTLGEGSVFTVCLELPMTEHHHQRIQSGASAQDVPAGTTAFASSVQSGSLGHVLLVEDWQPNILVACLMLEMLGYTYDVVRSGGEAVSMVAKGVYDAVLMDIQLPGIDGFEATRRIRAMEAERGSAPLPIIAVTANAMLNDSERCLAAGMQHYISKPLDAERLGQALAAAVKAA